MHAVAPLLLMILEALRYFTPGAATTPPRCTEVTFTVTATAEHYVWEGSPDPSDELDLVNYVKDSLSGGPAHVVEGSSTVSGTFEISGTFCEPYLPGDAIHVLEQKQATLAAANNSNILQILLPGNTFHKGVWSCYGYAEKCNWQAYAASREYYTLALDRLGTGKSTRPDDPIGTMQTAIQIEITHQIIQTIRSGPGLPSALNTKFDKIVVGGFSYGSLLGLALSRLYPDDADAYVLTGYSGRLFMPAAVLLMHFIPARRVLQKPHFANLPLGYLTAATEGTSTNSLYHGAYDQELARLDWENRDVVTPGEYASLSAAVGISRYKGPVMVISGDEDAIFCNTKFGTCADNLAAAKESFPEVDKFSYFVAPKTGHGILTHESAPEVHAAVHDWLAEVI